MSHQFFAAVPKNMETLLLEELRTLGVEDARETRAGVGFSGELETGYRVCLWSRLASRVLLVLEEFSAESEEMLYAGAKAIDWSAHFGTGQTFAVDLNLAQSNIRHSRYAALKVKDAIVDRFRDETGVRPSVDTLIPDIRINVHLRRDQARVSLDLAGDSLNRRGYRQEGGAAPLKENLAAAILLRANWPAIAGEGGCLLDPMCGSGTLLIEGALMAGDQAPGLLRERWGFSAWKRHQAGSWESLLCEARQRRDAGLGRIPPIIGYDHNPATVKIARDNLARAGLEERIRIEPGEMADCQAPPGTGLLLTNPPYGERMGEASQLPALYAQLGSVLKRRFTGWRAAVFTGNPELGKFMGLRALRQHALFNGSIECRLLHFEIEPEHFVSPRNLPRPLSEGQWGEGARMFANRLRKNRQRLKGWLKQQEIRCYRIYDADLPEYAVAVDVYQGESLWLHVQEYEAPKTVDPAKARLRLKEILGVLLAEFGIGEEQLFLKTRRRQKGKSQYEKLSAQGRFHEVEEGGNRFLVNFEEYLDTGLFLDHRPTRQLVGRLAADRHFLNLFAYTGTASVYAARGGARSTVTVDMSKTYLEWAERNMALNGFAGKKHRFFRADCLEWLDRADPSYRYGLIFLDPPSFSTSKRMAATLDVQRDHVALITKSMRLLERDGVLIFSNNLRGFRMDLEALSSFGIKEISAETLPRDFQRNPKIHNCWEIRHRPA